MIKVIRRDAKYWDMANEVMFKAVERLVRSAHFHGTINAEIDKLIDIEDIDMKVMLSDDIEKHVIEYLEQLSPLP